MERFFSSTTALSRSARRAWNWRKKVRAAAIGYRLFAGWDAEREISAKTWRRTNVFEAPGFNSQLHSLSFPKRPVGVFYRATVAIRRRCQCSISSMLGQSSRSGRSSNGRCFTDRTLPL
jgi:hypothetical protein